MPHVLQLLDAPKKTINFDGLIRATGGLATITKAGVIVDSDITATGVAAAVDGLLGVDTSGNQLMFRSSGMWFAAGGGLSLIHTLAQPASASATTCLLDRTPVSWAVTGRNILVLVGVGTTHLEIRKPTISSATVTFDNRLWYDHAAGETVLLYFGDELPFAFWGAKFDNTADDSDAIQAGLNQSSLYGGPWIVGAGTNQVTGLSVAKVTRPIIHTAHARARRTQAQASSFVGADAVSMGMWQSANHPISVASASAATDTFTVTQSFGGTGANAQDKVCFFPPPGGTLPGGISPGVVYYVVSSFANVNVGTTYQVSATSGGAAIDLTSDGTAILYQKLTGVARIYCDDIQLDGGGTANLNGFHLVTQQPSESHKIRASNFPGIGIWSDVVTQQGKFYNTQVDNCGVGYQLDGFGVTFDYVNPESCGVGLKLNGDANTVANYHGENNTREVIFGLASGSNGRGSLILGTWFPSAGLTPTTAPFYIAAGAGSCSFSVVGAVCANLDVTGAYILYDEDLGNHVIYDGSAGTHSVIGHLYKPDGGGTPVLLDRFFVNKDGGFSWLRGPDTYQQRPQSPQTSPVFYAGNTTPDNARGVTGDFFFRFDTPDTVSQRIYVKSAGGWISALPPAVVTNPALAATNTIQPTADIVPLTIRGKASQTADLVQWQNSTPTTLLAVSAAGRIVGQTQLVLEEQGDSFGTVRFYLQNRNGVNGAMFEQAGSFDLVDFVFKGLTNQRNIRYEARSGSQLVAAPEFQIGDPVAGASVVIADDRTLIRTVTAARVPLTVRGAASQSASLHEWQDSGAAILSRFDKNGYFMTRKKAAPADGDLANSELAIWFDDTVSATKAMFKAKDSAGTVRTAAVALA